MKIHIIAEYKFPLSYILKYYTFFLTWSGLMRQIAPNTENVRHPVVHICARMRAVEAGVFYFFRWRKREERAPAVGLHNAYTPLHIHIHTRPLLRWIPCAGCHV